MGGVREFPDGTISSGTEKPWTNVDAKVRDRHTFEISFAKRAFRTSFARSSITGNAEFLEFAKHMAAKLETGQRRKNCLRDRLRPSVESLSQMLSFVIYVLFSTRLIFCTFDVVACLPFPYAQPSKSFKFPTPRMTTKITTLAEVRSRSSCGEA